jgi:hypothetical protein
MQLKMLMPLRMQQLLINNAEKERVEAKARVGAKAREEVKERDGARELRVSLATTLIKHGNHLTHIYRRLC